MLINEKNNVKYLTFENIEKTRLTHHAFSTRIGGVSDGVYSEMNLGYSTGDKWENISENFGLLADAVGFKAENFVFSDQVHKTNIYHVTHKDCGKGLFRENDIKEADALITCEAGVVLVTFYADCTPLFFLDPKRKIAALAHAGWRGTVMEIGRLTVEELYRVYGCEPSDILAGIGPCIGSCCFEVDTDVYSEFEEKLPFSERYITKRELQGQANTKYNIDLAGVNKQILLNAGLRKENIETADMCTKCRSDLFYSHRRTGNPRGSMAAFITMGSVDG